MDYLAPTAAEMCPVDIVHLQTPSRFSETGAKGMGEGGTIGAPAAVLGAINDALSGTGRALRPHPGAAAGRERRPRARAAAAA